LLDIRVGQIVRAWKHDEAETLYVEEVDIGENEPRIICSGLVNYIPLENLQVYLFLFPFSFNSNYTLLSIIYFFGCILSNFNMK
jgi:tRNA-binding EMAP/Myf-like protein